jgi:hypothetical protein
MGDEGQGEQGAHGFCGRGGGGGGALVWGGEVWVGMEGQHVRTPGGGGWKAEKGRVSRERTGWGESSRKVGGILEQGGNGWAPTVGGRQIVRPLSRSRFHSGLAKQLAASVQVPASSLRTTHHALHGTREDRFSH